MNCLGTSVRKHFGKRKAQNAARMRRGTLSHMKRSLKSPLPESALIPAKKAEIKANANPSLFDWQRLHDLPPVGSRGIFAP